MAAALPERRPIGLGRLRRPPAASGEPRRPGLLARIDQAMIRSMVAMTDAIDQSGDARATEPRIPLHVEIEEILMAAAAAPPSPAATSGDPARRPPIGAVLTVTVARSGAVAQHDGRILDAGDKAAILTAVARFLDGE